MKLKMLRQHYKSNDNVTWTPKRAFDTEEQIKEQLGFDLDMCDTYVCTFCNKIHIATSLKERINDN